MRIPPLLSDTINSYITHAADALTASAILPTTISARNAHLTFMLSAYSIEDHIAHPLLDKLKIPLTYLLLCDSLVIITAIFSSSPAIVLAVQAAFCLGYAASLRPSEYLHTTSRIVPTTKQLWSSSSYFWFNDVPYCVCDPAAFPPGQIPDMFSGILIHRKNEKRGKGSPIAIANPSSPTPRPVNCLSSLFQFLRAYPPLPNAPLFAGSPINITSDLHLKPVLNAVARKHNLPCNKLLPHSSIRSAVLSQIDDQSDEVKQR